MDDNKGFVKIWLSYSAYFEAYSAAEVGRLVLAMMQYKSSGVEPEFSGNERFIWPAIRRDIDMATKIEESTATRNRQNGLNGGRPKKPTETQANPKNPVGFDETQTNPKKAMEKVKVKETVKGSNNPLPPSSAETGFGDELQAAFESWLAYKAERKEPYRATGLRSLVSQLRKKSEKYGESALAELIQDCMASGWKGIIYEKLEKSQSAPSGQKRTEERQDWAELAEQMAAGMEGGLP